MSYHFEIKKNRHVTYKSILNTLNVENVRIAHSDELDLNTGLSGYRKFYIPDVSSRGVTIGDGEVNFDIGINVLASKADYILACELAKAIAEITDAKIKPEDEGEALSIDVFEKKYNESWAEGYKTLGLNMIKHIIQDKQDTITIGGCLRNYFMGPDILNELTKDNPDDEVFYIRIIDSIKSVQYIDENKIRIPNIFEVTEKDDSTWEYIVLIPEREQLLQGTDFVFMAATEDVHHKVPFEVLKTYAVENFKRLDEKQFLFPSMSMETFYKLMRHFGYADQKKWWKFWN